MTVLPSSRHVLLGLGVLGLLTALPPARAADDMRARQLVSAPATFPAYVFAGTKLPECIGTAAAARAALGEHTVKYTHTSGLDRWPAELYRDEAPDLEERVALAYPHLRVGRAWAYNGQGYALGGKVIEAVTGEAVPPGYRKHLLGPLGMDAAVGSLTRHGRRKRFGCIPTG